MTYDSAAKNPRNKTDSSGNPNESFEEGSHKHLGYLEVIYSWNSHSKEEWFWGPFVSLLISPTVQSAKHRPWNET